MTAAPAQCRPPTRPRANGRSRARGFTLLEIMIVVLIGGLMASSAVVGFGATRRGRLRAASARVAAAMRFAYVHALTTGRATRLVISVGGNSIWIEDTQDAHVLDPNDPLRAGGATVDAEQIEAIARREAEAQINLRPRAPRAEFARPAGNRYRVRELEGIEFTRLYSSHEVEPRERGDGHIYFFTGGAAEPAVVHIHGGNDETFSVMLHGASGRPEIFDHAVELPRVDENESDERDVDLRDQRVREAEH
ncbi:MAG: ral secretion pathway protein [Myxococcaceae bacterium]|nr:ral secretion pathway protein [Myxococcaceae bacterium]